MKKKINYIVLVIIMYIFMITNVKAISFNCTSTNIESGKDLICNINLDNEEKMTVTSDLKIKNVTGDTNTYSGKSASFNTTGTIVFITDNLSGNYTINAKGGTGFNRDVSISIKEKTTTTTTTTKVTTTTKAKSDNNYLKSIKINKEEIEDFSKNTTKYFIDVENEINNINITAEAEDETATVKIDGPKTLEVGDNEYTISVTSESDSTKNYKIIVTRKDEEESSNTDIKSIKIKGYHLNFDKNSKTFHLKINKEDTELDINVKLKDKNASYDIEGNDNLKDGSIIKIKVTAEDDTTDTYRIIVEKEDKNIIPLIIGGITFLFIMIIIIIITFRKKKNNKKEDTKEVLDKEEQYNEDKTIEMPVIKDANEYTTSIDTDEEEYTSVDNDEEEKTRILSYVEQKELARQKREMDEMNRAIDEAFDDEYDEY